MRRKPPAAVGWFWVCCSRWPGALGGAGFSGLKWACQESWTPHFLGFRWLQLFLLGGFPLEESPHCNLLRLRSFRLLHRKFRCSRVLLEVADFRCNSNVTECMLERSISGGFPDMARGFSQRGWFGIGSSGLAFFLGLLRVHSGADRRHHPQPGAPQAAYPRFWASRLGREGCP